MNNNQLMEALLQMNKAQEQKRQVITLCICMGIMGLIVTVYLLKKNPQNPNYASIPYDYGHDRLESSYSMDMNRGSDDQNGNNTIAAIRNEEREFGYTISNNIQ